MQNLERLLAELIALPSVNPAFLPAGDARAGEKPIADFIAATAARVGLDVEFRNVLPGRANLLVRLSPVKRAECRILLVPHLDTVAGIDRQFVPERRHGRLFGRGACDTKGSVAVMLAAVCELACSPQRPTATEIAFASVIDEEHAQAGSRALAGSGQKANLAIVGEPTNLRVVTAHKGSLWLHLETKGKSAHGARPELGRNAVHQMARIVDLLETEYATELRKRAHSLLGSATVSVGVIQGGAQPNIVPDHCAIEVDRRTLPGETEQGVGREIRSFLRRHGLRASSSSSKLLPCLPMETSPRLPLVSQFLRCAGQARPQGVDYFCDASILSQAGIASVVFGPGNIAQAHTADEWISLSELRRGLDLLLRFLRSLP